MEDISLNIGKMIQRQVEKRKNYQIHDDDVHKVHFILILRSFLTFESCNPFDDRLEETGNLTPRRATRYSSGLK